MKFSQRPIAYRTLQKSASWTQTLVRSTWVTAYNRCLLRDASGHMSAFAASWRLNSGFFKWSFDR